MPKVICFFSLVVCSEKYPNFLLRTYIPYRKKEKEVIENLTFEMERRGTRSLRMKVEIGLIVSSECLCSRIGTPTSS